MENQQRLQHALAADDVFASLSELARRLRDEGVSQSDLYRLFATAHQSMLANDFRQELLMDILDEIHGGGWAKRGGLYPTELGEEKG